MDGANFLVAHRVRFYSELDEQNFFAWLRKISLVKEISGRGEDLLIWYDAALAFDESLREIIAAFFRYGIETAQLDVFLTPENQAWFMNEHSYWRKIHK